MIRLAVFGSPVKHSLSPRIHGLFAEQVGLDVDYRAIECGPAEFADCVRRLAADGGRGCNVTVPFKHDAWRLATRCSERATLARAVNTLRFEAVDDWYGDNTDGPGLADDLSGPLQRQLQNARICLLGAGGAAAGVLGALLEASPAALVVANRSVGKANDLAERHRDLGPVAACSLAEAARRGPYDLVLNSTSLGHEGAAPPIDAGWFAADGLCYDLNYGRASEPLCRLCRSLRVAYADGLGMLVAQAARSFELWTGRRPDTGPVLAELRAAS